MDRRCSFSSCYLLHRGRKKYEEIEAQNIEHYSIKNKIVIYIQLTDLMGTSLKPWTVSQPPN